MKNTRGQSMMAGNWKMNMTRQQTSEYLESFLKQLPDGQCKTILCVPYTDLDRAIELTRGTGLAIGAQNCHWAKSGAFTGEISADQLAELGAEYVILGHSERRQYFGETDRTVNQRLRAALDAGLKVILCVGELLEERQSGVTDEICAMQIKLDLAGLTAQELDRVIIAYEPVWAIGTGLTATPEQAQETIGMIRQTVSKLYDRQTASQMLILYGGSMNSKNTEQLMAMPDINGGLIGGASLKPEEFSIMAAMAGRCEQIQA